MPGLVETEFCASGKSDGCDGTEASFRDRSAEFDAVALEVCDGGLDFVAHQVHLVVASLLRRMNAEFGGRERKDEPAMAGIDRRKFENVAKEGADFFGVVAVDQGVGAGDHRLSSMRQILFTSNSFRSDSLRSNSLRYISGLKPIAQRPRLFEDHEGVGIGETGIGPTESIYCTAAS